MDTYQSNYTAQVVLVCPTHLKQVSCIVSDMTQNICGGGHHVTARLQLLGCGAPVLRCVDGLAFVINGKHPRTEGHDLKNRSYYMSSRGVF